MAELSSLKNLDRRIQAGVFLAGGTTEILDIAPIDLLHAVTPTFLHMFPPGLITEKMAGQALDVDFHWVNEKGDSASLTARATIDAIDSFETCPPLDIVLMRAHNMDYQLNEAELNFIRKSHKDCTAFLTICGGFVNALNAGLLKGKTATAPRIMLDMLRTTAPDTEWIEKRWHRDGKIWTTGALLNGTDMMRAFGTELCGDEADNLMQFALDVGAYPRRCVNYTDVESRL